MPFLFLGYYFNESLVMKEEKYRSSNFNYKSLCPIPLINQVKQVLHYWPAFVRALFWVRFNFGQINQLPIGRNLSYSQFLLFWTILWRTCFTLLLGHIFNHSRYRIAESNVIVSSGFWHIILQKCNTNSIPGHSG